MKRHPSRATRIVALALASIAAPLIALGCGGGMHHPQEGGMSPPPGEPQDPALAFDQAEREMKYALGIRPADTDGSPAQSPSGAGQQPGALQQGAYATPPPPPYPMVAPAPTEARTATETEAKRAEAGASTADSAQSSPDPCATACRALGSMDRAASHLCDLSGEDNVRCASAKDRLRRAGDLVRQRCPSCAS